MKDSMIVVLPGDDITERIEAATSASAAVQQLRNESPTAVVKLGTGVMKSSSKLSIDDPCRISATAAGQLEARSRGGGGGVYFVRQNLKRYYRPSLEDRVVGIVMDRQGVDSSTGGDIYRIDIGGSHSAQLSSLSFEGATKRNRPSLQPGQVLYCRVSAVHAHLDPVLSCQLGPEDTRIPRKDWMTSEGCYGELRGGTLCRVPTGLARQLLQPQCVVLTELSRRIAFEVAIGVNGYLWIHSSRPEHTIVVQNAILNSTVLNDEQVRAMVHTLVYSVEKQIQMQKDMMEH
jgi:exosome complex component RRP40